MYTKTFTTAALALAASSLVSAQTFTDCNPLKKTCPADPAFGNSKVNCDLTKGACGAFTELDGTSLTYDGSKGAVFSIEKETNAPTIKTNKYIFFGRLDVELQAAKGNGIVTSAVLQSDDLDEIDWEWVGGDDTQAQSNYFSKGDTTTYDRGAYHTVANPVTTFHTYSVEWTSKYVHWIIDGNVVRTLNYADAKGGSAFPQTPMEVRIGTWVAGRKDAPKGTVEWAGGYTDFTQAPFNAYYKSIAITDYAGGDGPAPDAVKEYIYGDNTGSYQSIKVQKGESDDSDDNSSAPVSTTKAPSSTSTGKSDATTTKATTESTKAATTKATTMTTAASHNTTMTTSVASTSAPASTSAGSASTSAPATIDKPNSASKATFGSVILAAAGLMAAQLL